MTLPPRKIQVIKELREIFGVGLGEAKAAADWLYRKGGSIELLIDDVQKNHTQNYDYTYVAAPPRTVPGSSPIGTVSFDASGAYGDLAGRVSDLEETVNKLKAWVPGGAE